MAISFLGAFAVEGTVVDTGWKGTVDTGVALFTFTFIIGAYAVVIAVVGAFLVAGFCLEKLFKVFCVVVVCYEIGYLIGYVWVMGER